MEPAPSREMSGSRILITGTGAVCGAGMNPESILDEVSAGRSSFGPITLWDTAGWPCRVAAEIADFNPRALVDDRKLHKMIRRTDLVGIYAAGSALATAGIVAHRDSLDPSAAAAFNDRSGVFVGSGGGNYQNQYDFFPLMTEAHGDLAAFGRELTNTVNPMWLLRTLPNNVLGHLGIRYMLKGPNTCITNHSCAGAQTVMEAAAALRAGEADRAVAVGHDTPIEPEMVLYYYRLGLLAASELLPFDVRRTGSLFGEGAGAMMLETEASATQRKAPVIGEYLGGGYACEAQGLIAIRDDGDGVARAIRQALDEAGIRAADVGMIVAHGNGTPQSDASEAAAIRKVFGSAAPPVTAFKWSFGHLIAAAGIAEATVALVALKRGVVPGIAVWSVPDPDCAGVPVSASAQEPTSDVALVICRGFASTNAALVVRAL
jgi:3-oxoacyl-[acyl-carrier-protein] synthase-1